MSREFWEERYGNAEFVYGKLPNKYFKEKSMNCRLEKHCLRR